MLFIVSIMSQTASSSAMFSDVPIIGNNGGEKNVYVPATNPLYTIYPSNSNYVNNPTNIYTIY